MNYFERKEISNSDLGVVKDKGYKGLLQEKANKTPPTKPMVLGTLLHSYILENRIDWVTDAEIMKEVGGAKPRLKKEYKSWVADKVDEGYIIATGVSVVHPIGERSNKAIITEDVEEMFEVIHEEIKKSNSAFILDNVGRNDVLIEHEVYFEQEEVKCRSKLDYINTEKKIVVDLKSIAKADPRSLENAVKYSYARQAAFYLNAAEAEFGGEWSFYFVFVEKEAPNRVILVKPSAKTIYYGQIEISKILTQLKEEKDSKNGYIDMVEI